MRVFYFGREFQANGHDVSLITSAFSHKYFKQPETHRGMTYGQVRGLRYCWLPTLPYSGNGLRRMVNHLQFALALDARGKRLRLPHPDVIIASSPPPLLLPATLRIARHFNAKLAFEVRDLWPLSVQELNNMSRWHPAIQLMAHCEKTGYRGASVVVSALPLAREYMESRGMQPGKFTHIPNGVHIKETLAHAQPLNDEASAALARVHGKKLVGYVGAHNRANALDSLLRAAALVQRQTDGVHFILVGTGYEKPALVALAHEMRLKNVTFLEAIPRDQVQALLTELDVCFIGLKRESVFRFGISPNKMFEYMLAGKPIVSAIDAGNDLVAEAGCGRTVTAEDPAAIAAGILQIADADRSELGRMGRNARRYVEQTHSIEQLAVSYIDALRAQ